jgi:hypothetical protein
MLMKETRALLPVWCASMIVVAAGTVVKDTVVLVAGLFAFGLGSVALGALAIGHEYSHRTIGLLLAQPVDRRRLLLTKIGVVVPMLLALAATARFAILADTSFLPRSTRPDATSMITLVTLCSLFLAPYLTMICRGPLAGIVFAISTPFAIAIVGDLLGTATYGFEAAGDIDRFKIATLWWGMWVTSATVAVAGWRTFGRLEVIEGRDPDVRVAEWLGESTAADVPARRRHPVLMLVKKELRLQQMTFVVVGLFVLGWMALRLLQRFLPEGHELPLTALTIIYFALLSILIGSLASAEERQFGTLEWQTLLPMAAWQQWAVKAGVAIGLAVLLGVGLTVLLAYVGSAGDELPRAAQVWRQLAEATVAIVLLTTASLYVSSFSPSGVRALVLCVPVIVGALLFVRAVVWVSIWSVPVVSRTAAYSRLNEGAVLLLLSALAASLFLWFGLVNHRSAERNFRRAGPQMVSIAALLVLSIGTVTALSLL